MPTMSNAHLTSVGGKAHDGWPVSWQRIRLIAVLQQGLDDNEPVFAQGRHLLLLLLATLRLQAVPQNMNSHAASSYRK